MSTLLSTPSAAPAADEPGPRPPALTYGAWLAAALSALAAIGLVAAAVAITVYRYTHDDTSWNNPAPVYATEMVALLVLAGFSAYSLRSSLRVLAWSGVARTRTVGLGTAALVVLLVVGLRSLRGGAGVITVVAAVWFVLTTVSLALLSSSAANTWMETRSPFASVWRWIRGNIVSFLGLLVMAYLYIPNVVVAAMSFNLASGKRTVYQWNEFSLSNWTDICKPDGMCQSVVTSLWIGVVATIGACLIGTMAAFALVRHRFAGRSTSNVVLFLPMATPEIVMGSSLLALFVAIGLGGHLGHTTIIIAHIMFCLSYVVVTVKARLAGLDQNLEQAAMDLYADERTTFFKVTLPLVFPGILAAALLSFSLSFDDFIVTNLNAGTTVTFPMYVWGAAQRGLPMQVNAIGTLMFVLAIAVVAIGELNNRRRARA